MPKTELHEELRNAIVRKYIKIGRFADELGVRSSVVSAKLAGRVGFTIDDMKKWSKLVDIKECDIPKYFF